jgi:hypothetical protein
MPCPERDQLNEIYIDALARNNASAVAALDGQSQREARRNEMRNLRTACEAALEALDRHIAKHGC